MCSFRLDNIHLNPVNCNLAKRKIKVGIIASAFFIHLLYTHTFHLSEKVDQYTVWQKGVITFEGKYPPINYICEVVPLIDGLPFFLLILLH